MRTINEHITGLTLFLASGLGVAACGSGASSDTGNDTDDTDDSGNTDATGMTEGGSGTDETGDTTGGTSGTTDSETTGDSTGGTDSDGMDPDACSGPTESLSELGYYVGSETWPRSDETQVEAGRCTVDSSEVSDSFHPNVVFHMSCIEANGAESHDVVFTVDQASIGDRLDYLVGMEVQLEFQTHGWYMEHVRHEVATLRDPDGNLLFAGGFHTFLPAASPEGEPLSYEGSVAGLPVGDTMPSEWPSPFTGFVIRDGLCAEGPADRPGAEFETRFGVEFETDGDPVVLLDRSEADIVRDGVAYHAMVGDAFHRRELNCGDCMAMELKFMVIAAED